MIDQGIPLIIIIKPREVARLSVEDFWESLSRHASVVPSVQ